MAKSFSITITQVVGGNYQPDESLTELKLVEVDTEAEIAGSHVGDGVYAFGSVPDGTYKLFNGETEITKWGGTNGRWIGDEALPYMGLATANEWGGEDKQLTSIADPTAGHHVGDRDYNDARYLELSGGEMNGDIDMDGNDVLASGNLLDKTSAQTASGAKGWTGMQTWAGGGLFQAAADLSKYPKIQKSEEEPTYIAPSDPTHIATKQYADSLVAGITVPAAPFGATEVVVIDGITQVLGKIYSSLKNASDYMGTISLSAEKKGVIYLRQNPTKAYSIMAAATMRDFISVRGYGRALITSAGDPPAWNNAGSVIVVFEKTSTKKMSFFDSTLIFGNENSGTGFTNNQTGAREYTNTVFSNCLILAYNDITFNTCILDNCIVIHSGSFKSTLTACHILGTKFNNEPVANDTNHIADYTAGITWQMPNDITGYIPES